MVTRFNLTPTIVVCFLLISFSTYTQQLAPGFAGRVAPISSGEGPTQYPVTGASDMVVIGNYAYVVTLDNEFYIIDISIPYAPVVVSKIVHGTGSVKLNRPTGISVSGNYAFISAESSNALEIIDITNKSAPAHAGSISDSPTGAELTLPSDVVVVGNLAYVARSGGLEIVDVTSKTAPVHKSKIDVGVGMLSLGMAVSGNYVYICTSTSLSVIDVSDPDTPVALTTIFNDNDPIRISEPSPPVIKGNYLFMTSRTHSSLEIFDVSDPSNPTPAGTMGHDENGSVLINPNTVFVSGDYAYVTNQHLNTLEVVNISTPTSPTHQAVLESPVTFQFLTNPTSSFVTGNYAFFGTQSGLEIFYLFTPTPPVVGYPQSSSPGAFITHWSTVHNATGYLLDVSDDDFATFLTGYNSLALAPSETSLEITGLDAAKTYQYRVRATNINGSSDYSDKISTPPSPFAPVATAASDPGQKSFTTNWNASPGVPAYAIDVTSDETFTDPLTFKRTNEFTEVTNYPVTDLEPGTIYYYRVRSVNTLGTSGNSNVISQITVPPTPTAEIADPIGQTSFTAKWNTAKGATGYFVDVLDDADAILANYNNVSVTNGTSLVVDGVDAGTDYSFVVRATNSAGTTVSSEKQPVLTRPPTPVPALAETTGSVSFKANWQSSKSATTYHINVFSENGAALPGYSNFDAGETTTTVVTVNAPTTGATFSYQVSASNVNGPSPFSEPMFVKTPVTSFPSITLPTGGTVESYMIVSLPGGTVASTALGSESFAKTWRVMRFETATNSNVNFPSVQNMEPGKGYWVNSNLDEAPTITITGQTTFLAQQMTLLPGWNQIGNPLSYNISWSDLLSENSTITNVGELYTYNVPTAGSGFTQQDILRAYGGGFVNNMNTVNVTLTIPPNMQVATGRLSGANQITSKDILAKEWFLPIMMEVNGRANSLSGIGMHPDAKSSIDQFDAIALPRMFNFTEISSNHPEFFQPRFMRDVVPTALSHTWKMDIASNSGDEATLSWNNTAWTGGSMFLIDDGAGVLLDMSSIDHYSCGISQKRSLRFAFSADGNFPSDVTAFGLPYPNPSTDRIKFPFIAGDGEMVTVRITDMTGRTVRELTNANLVSGYNEIFWDITADQPVSGIYLFQGRTSGGKYKTGRIVVR